MSYDTVISSAVENFNRHTRHLDPKTVEPSFIKMAKILAPYAFSKKPGNGPDIAKVFLGLKPLCVINGGEYSNIHNALSRDELFKKTVDIADTLYGRRVTEDEEEVCEQLEWETSTSSLFFILCRMYGLVVLNTYSDTTEFIICWNNNIADALIYRDMVHEIIKLPPVSRDKYWMQYYVFRGILEGDDLESIVERYNDSRSILSRTMVAIDVFIPLWDSLSTVISDLRIKYSKDIPMIL